MLISVAMCTYNGEKFISSQLESILHQKRAVDEIIIYDDCSSDNTVTLIKNIITRTEIKIKLLQNSENLGAIRSFEKCIKACSGDIIFLSDQDDVWYPDKVTKYLIAFANDYTVKAVFSNGELINEIDQRLGNNLWTAWSFTPELQKKWRNNDFAFSKLAANQNVITGATLAFRKDIMSLLFPFELPSGYWHDTWIGIIAASSGGLRFLSESTIFYRIHQQQQVGIIGAIDKKFNSIPYSQFQYKILKLFPHKKKLIFVKNSSLVKFRKSINFLKKIICKLFFFK